MPMEPGPDITALLKRIHANDPNARDELLARVYEELRRMAAALMKRERIDHTLQATALLNEALRRLLGSNVLERTNDRAYLFASVHRAMRQVLAEHARGKDARKRQGGRQRVPLDDVLDRVADRWKLDDSDIVAVHEALERLAERDPRQSQVVDLKIFGGLTNRTVADQLQVSEPTVERDFRLARAYLRQQLAQDGHR
jgi:RNA polymerase sigma factor (TIGR02999 family)